MKIIYILLIFNIWQSILTGDLIDLDVEPGTLSSMECEYKEEDGTETIKYGFSFIAKASGFTKERKFQLILKTPQYAYAICTVPISQDGARQNIKCLVDANLFPLYEIYKIELPKKLELVDNDITITNWDEFINVSSIVQYVRTCYPIYTRQLDKIGNFEVQCYEGFNLINAKASYKGLDDKNLRNLVTESDSYEFKPYLVVDDNYYQATCYAFFPPDPDETENTEDYYDFQCQVKGNDYAYFFPTTTIETETEFVTRFNIEERVELKQCGSNSLSSTFSKFAALLLLSLVLF